MKNHFSLHELTDRLILGLLPGATKMRTFFVNSIARELPLNANQELLTDALSALLQHTVASAKNTCIDISAKMFEYITIMHIRCSQNEHQEAISPALLQFQPLAEKLGGYICVSGNTVRGTTIVFTFANPVQAERQSLPLCLIS